MKKIIFISVVSFCFSQMSNSMLASLQQELTILSDNLVELKRALKQKTNINFAELLKEAQETALTQKQVFNKISSFLKRVTSDKEIVSVYGRIKRNYKESLETTNKLRKLVNKIYRLHYESIFKRTFNKQVINLYKKIKNDWKNYANEFHNFVEKNKDTEFFNKEVFIQDEDRETENFKLKPYIEGLDAHISKTNDELQNVLEEYIKEVQESN